MDDIILETKDLKKYYKTSFGDLHAVDGVNIRIQTGQTLGIVGESGCGKSTLGRLMLRLIEPTGGAIFFQGQDILKYSKSGLRKLRKDIQIIFQDPYSSIDPRMSVSQIIAEPMINYRMFPRGEVNNQVKRLMEVVGLSPRLADTYPHELDGGRRQRIGVARALSLNPKFIICDEPVSALDVSIQAQILNLLMDIQQEFKLTYMFITHDLSVVKHISHNIAVMYLGQVVELADKKDLFRNPLHPYTRALLKAIPIPSLEYRNRTLETIKGEVSSPIDPIPGCRFAPRCDQAGEHCIDTDPVLKEVKPNHWVACAN